MARKSRDGDSSSSRYVRKREHSIFWSSRDAAAAIRLPPGLKGFFARFGNKNFRAFPWCAKNVSSFHLLLVEVLLVQTKAEDVACVWPRLIHEYPTPFALAKARTGRLARLLRSLGLQNQRAKSLKVISRTLTKNFDGKVPQSLEALLSIPYL